MALQLYTNNFSRGVVVDWLLIELGIECERIEVAFQTEMKTPEYLKINPFGKVPVLVDGDVVVYELDAICAYLADKFADKGLAPALNDPKRGVYYRWLFFISGPWRLIKCSVWMSHLSKNLLLDMGIIRMPTMPLCKD